MIYHFSELPLNNQLRAGAKATTLAKLFKAGFPVPEGFVIMPEFFNEEISSYTFDSILNHIANLRKNKKNFLLAVRSSALSEDSAQASFAGIFETVLNVSSYEEVLNAIFKVRKSMWTNQVISYRKEKSLDVDEMAIIVQVMIKADFSGILFTADPLTGNRNYLVGNYTFGDADKLVSGKINGDFFKISRLQAEYKGPDKLKFFSRKLHELALRLEKELGCPLDIEWAISQNKVYILQARPIVSMQFHNPTTGFWNDSLRGDFLWTSTNWGEAVPDVMTPFTWSVLQWMAEISPYRLPGNIPSNGNIGGRFYFNVSLFVSMASTFRIDKKKLLHYGSDIFGKLPEFVDIPVTIFSKWEVLRTYGVSLILQLLTFPVKCLIVPHYIKYFVETAYKLRSEIDSIISGEQLINFWQKSIKSFVKKTNMMMDLVFSQMFFTSAKLRHDLTELIGPTDATLLLSSARQGSGNLENVEFLISLSKVVNGEMDLSEYVSLYGHRSEHEVEMSFPRPAENPMWIKKQMSEFLASNIDIRGIINRRQSQYQNAMRRLLEIKAGNAKSLQKRIEKNHQRAILRERVRSIWSHMFWIIRTYALQAGRITGLGTDIFFLTIQEVQAALQGDKSAFINIPLRRDQYLRYCELSSYPTIINGRFDPFAWSESPNRSSDIVDSHVPLFPVTNNGILGLGGAPGIVEGAVRVLTKLEETDQLQIGEILVTRLANIGWTVVFPRTAGIITDIGAPLSHAAIVAQELGIPMVVGCGNATSQLKTGDRVIINGAQGTIEILQKA